MERLLKASDVAEILQCSISMAYRIVRELNAELQQKGYYICRGRVPKTYFAERFNLKAGD